MSDCFKMSNVVCRAEVVNMEFDGLRDYKELQEKKENCTMDTWKTELQDVFGKTIARQNDEQDLFNLFFLKYTTKTKKNKPIKSETKAIRG